MRMVRVTLKPDGLDFMVESGEFVPGSLTASEQKELELLIDQLIPYGDFTAFKDLASDEIKQVTQLKHRRAELEQKKTESSLEFIPVPIDEVYSIILVIRPNHLPVYVQNMPEEWIDKLFSQNFTLNMGAPIQGNTATPEPEEATKPAGFVYDSKLSLKHNKIRETLQKAGGLDLVEITIDPENPELINITPLDWLGDDYKPIDTILRNQFGESASWVSKGRGDRKAHWSVL